ncbi:MAG: DUF3368 domain-containing protein [Cyanobacteria bacterium P01_F01_bin.86]
MTRRWVVNASPIITLTKIGQVDLLHQLCDDLVIPQGVADEIQGGGYDDPATKWIQTHGQDYLRPAPSIDSVVASWDLGMGESQVIAWSVAHTGYETILDDLAARKVASLLSITVRGTVSVIALAKQQGLIASAREEYDKLISVGFRISSDVIERALKLLGE